MPSVLKWVAKNITSDGVITALPCILRAVTVYSTTAAGRAIVHDHATAASGDVVADLGAATQYDTAITPPLEVRCRNGLYVNLTTASVTVYYELEY